MRLDFKALWVDDQPRHIASFAEGIRRKLKEMGFELDLVTAPSLEAIDTFIGEHVHEDGVDLVLVDYDLTGKGDGGEQALAKIRKRFPHKDMIFYSAMDTDKLRKIAFESRLDGIHFSTRLSLVDDTGSMIDKMLRKVMDVDHMRGVVMSATSDIDFIVEESLQTVCGRLSSGDQAAFIAKVVASVRGKLAKWGEELDKAEQKATIEALFKLKHLCTSADRLNLLVEELEAFAGDGSSQLEKAISYRQDVIPRRNKLAHVMLRVVDGKRVLEGPEGPFTEEDMTLLRCDLIEHRLNFTDIAVLLDVSLD